MGSLYNICPKGHTYRKGKGCPECKRERDKIIADKSYKKLKSKREKVKNRAVKDNKFIITEKVNSDPVRDVIEVDKFGNPLNEGGSYDE